MAQTVREFFESVPARIDPERMRGQHAVYRFDVDGAGTWIVAVDDGSIAVREGNEDADLVVRATEETFLRLVRGEQNPLTAYMTGKVRVEGDTALALRLRDLF